MLYVPDKIGSYSLEDVQFVLRDISHLVLEKSTEEREQTIQSGRQHYSEMLPIEYEPGPAYVQLYQQILADHAPLVAEYVAIVAEKIRAYRGLEQLVLVSLARAGTPIGILLKRYFQQMYKLQVPHYAISIIRDRGIDETALHYILERHPHAKLQFVDGWTGKGAISQQLEAAITKWNECATVKLDSYLAVLADPGHCAHFYGTQEDFLIPSACLNATVSGLVSRTVLNTTYMQEGDFHGAKYYRELAAVDVSNAYIEAIEPYYTSELQQRALTAVQEPLLVTPTWSGLQAIQTIQQHFQIASIHHIKPGVGETTRVLLRRVPWKVLVNPHMSQNLAHIYWLAAQRHVQIESYADMPYACCGLIQEMK